MRWLHGAEPNQIAQIRRLSRRPEPIVMYRVEMFRTQHSVKKPDLFAVQKLPDNFFFSLRMDIFPCRDRLFFFFNSGSLFLRTINESPDLFSGC